MASAAACRSSRSARDRDHVQLLFEAAGGALQIATPAGLEAEQVPIRAQRLAPQVLCTSSRLSSEVSVP